MRNTFELGEGRRQSALICACLLLLIAIAGCGSEPAEPVTVGTATETVAPVPTFTNTPLPEDTPAVTPEESPVELPTPEAAEPNGEDIATPAPEEEQVVDATAQTCEFAPDLDLAGYPNIESEMGCALSAASYEPVAINEFGEEAEYDRFMLWFSTTNTIYVLQPNGSWAEYEDTWKESVDEEVQCTLNDLPATSPPIPRRGFGKLWCTVDELKETMGTISREERLCQHAVTQEFANGRVLACFEDATIRYFRLLNEQTWNVNQVQ